MLIGRTGSVDISCEAEERFESEEQPRFEACDVTLNCGGKVRKIPLTKRLKGNFN